MSHALPPSTRLIFVLGCSHHSTPLALRERLAVPTEGLDTLYATLRALPGLEEIVVLNTCNRVEFYGVAARPDIRHQVAEAFARFHRLDLSGLEPYLFWRANHEAFEHLIRVASGLDSQMVGETEIFGQVKDSFASAQERHTVGPVLHRLFQKSFQEAKWARTHTSIARGQVSIGNVAVDLALRIFGEFRDCRILVLGTGEVGEKVAQAFLSRGARHLTVSSRTWEKARDLAARLSAAALEFSLFRDHLDRFDVVVSCTSAPDLILHRADLAAALRRRPAQPFFLIDLAVPRDIDPAAAQLDNVYLYNLDDLSAIANENLQARLSAVDAVHPAFARKAWSHWLQVFRRGPATPPSQPPSPAP